MPSLSTISNSFLGCWNLSRLHFRKKTKQNEIMNAEKPGFHSFSFCGFRFGKAMSQRLSKEVDGGVRARCFLLCSMCSSLCSSGCNSTGAVLLPPRNWTHPQLRQFTLSHKMASDGQPQDRADRPCGCGSSSPNKVRAVPRWVLSRSYVHANGHINDGCARVSCAI